MLFSLTEQKKGTRFFSQSLSAIANGISYYGNSGVLVVPFTTYSPLIRSKRLTLDTTVYNPFYEGQLTVINSETQITMAK